jgi:S-adenosylmethionine hydrolase
MKGVVLSINPEARVIDISHEIPPGDIFAAGFVLGQSYRYFPAGTVHVVVVDPGVGTARRVVLAKTNRSCFLAPDNGVLPLALGTFSGATFFSVENKEYRLARVSDTFHGRDIFAPAAAHLSAGTPPERFGPVHATPAVLSIPEPQQRGGEILLRILYVDAFGNLITNLASASPHARDLAEADIEVGDGKIRGIFRTYADVKEGELLALFGSGGFLEISMRGGDAGRALGLRCGDTVSLRKRDRTS